MQIIMSFHTLKMSQIGKVISMPKRVYLIPEISWTVLSFAKVLKGTMDVKCFTLK